MNIEIGQKVRLRRRVERFPALVAEAGMTGMVTWVGDAGGELTDVAVQMDEFIPGAEEWNNEIIWEGSGFTLPDLAEDLEVIG